MAIERGELGFRKEKCNRVRGRWLHQLLTKDFTYLGYYNEYCAEYPTVRFSSLIVNGH